MIKFTEKEIAYVKSLFNSFIDGDEILKADGFWSNEIEAVKKAVSVLDKVNIDAKANKLVESELVTICYFPFMNAGYEADEISEFLSDEDVSIYKKINEEE